MSTANGRSMSAPKRGHCPTAETQVPSRRRAVVHRLDAAAAVSTAAGDVGRDRHAGQGGHHRPERQAGPVWHDQCANHAPDGLHRPQRRDARRTGISAGVAQGLPTGRHDLASGRSSQRTYRGSDARAGQGTAHRICLAAKAVAGAECDGSVMEGAETRCGRKPAGCLNR